MVSNASTQKHLTPWWISVVVSNASTQKHLTPRWISVVVGGHENRKQLPMMVSETEQLPPPWPGPNFRHILVRFVTFLVDFCMKNIY